LKELNNDASYSVADDVASLSQMSADVSDVMSLCVVS